MDFDIRRCLQEAKDSLSTVSEVPLLEGEILLAFTLSRPRSYLHTYPDVKLTPADAKQFFHYVARRHCHEPIAYITGKKAFWSLELAMTPEVLIPRPETELLVEMVLEKHGSHQAIKVADLGTGSGAIALALAKERPAWTVYATDYHDNVINVAKKNAKTCNLNNVLFSTGHWCAALPPVEMDMIVSNPPYLTEIEWQSSAAALTFEPPAALVSGVEGLDAIQEIIKTAHFYLKVGGYLAIEHGYLQGAAVRTLLTDQGYESVYSVPDISGKDRVTLGRYSGGVFFGKNTKHRL